MSARAFDAILCQTTYTPEVLDFLGCCLSITASDHIASGEEHHEDYSAILVQLNVAKRFWNKPYSDLYTTMLTEYGMIVIALYRRDRYTGLPFVYTAPSPLDKVVNTDKMFVITNYPCNKLSAKYMQKESSARHFNLNDAKIPSLDNKVGESKET